MFRLSFVSLAVAAACALAPLPAHGQGLTQADLRAGMRVRVSTPQLESGTATVLANHGDTLLVLAGANDTVPLALASVRDIEVSVGMRRNRSGGAVAGLGIGGLIGAGIGAFTALTDREAGFPTFATMSGMAGGAVVGLVSGALLGAGRTDDWRRVGSDGRPVAARVAPHVGRTGVGLSVALPFGAP